MPKGKVLSHSQPAAACKYHLHRASIFSLVLDPAYRDNGLIKADAVSTGIPEHSFECVGIFTLGFHGSFISFGSFTGKPFAKQGTVVCKGIRTVTELCGQLASDRLVTELKRQLPLTFPFSLDDHFTFSKCPFYLAGHHCLLILTDRED